MKHKLLNIIKSNVHLLLTAVALLCVSQGVWANYSVTIYAYSSFQPNIWAWDQDYNNLSGDNWPGWLMTQIGSSNWYEATISVPDGKTYSYKFSNDGKNETTNQTGKSSSYQYYSVSSKS